MNVKPLSLTALCGMAMLIAAPASGGVVLTEDFNYADGPLNDGNPDWVNHSGTDDTLLVSGGQAVVTQDSGSEDLHKLFDGNASFTSGIVSASFDIVVTVPDESTGDPGAMSGTDFEFFAHFWQSTATTSFRSRTDLQVPNNPGPGNDYTIGIATLNSTAELALPVDFSFGTVVPVTITFDIDAGTSSLTAGGSTVNTAVVSMGQNIDGFALRQSNSSSDETILIDNLVVTHTAIPEPTSLVLMFAGLVGIGAMRRK